MRQMKDLTNMAMADLQGGMHGARGRSPLLRRMARLAACMALAALGACSTTGPSGLHIDRSIQAQSQNSRVEFVVLHYTSADNTASLKIQSNTNPSSQQLITHDAKPHVPQMVNESHPAGHT